MLVLEKLDYVSGKNIKTLFFLEISLKFKVKASRRGNFSTGNWGF